MHKYLGIELGSTRIKAVLIDNCGTVLASGGYEWENSLVDGLWSYSLDEAVTGLQASYCELVKNYGKQITTLDAIGISGMMHGYLALDKNDKLLAPFRTWRNTNTGEAAAKLSELFEFNIPMRWSVSQYYQSFLDKLEHVKDIKFLTTLAGYVHYLLTGEKNLGANDASGMFPLDGNDYNGAMLNKFNALIGKDFKKLLPKVLLAGETAGVLTEEGAKLIDPTGNLKAGAILCPPEGDMGTGMICTNSVSPRTANVSSGTSVNLTVILENPLKKHYPEIDIIATPSGFPAALVHTNNCTTEINEWVGLFAEVAKLCGADIKKGELFTKLFEVSQMSDSDCGKFVGYNYLAGEPLAKTTSGAPMVLRSPGGNLNLANFMQMQVYSAISAIYLGMDILHGEGVKLDTVTAHGGYYKTPYVGQSATSAMLKAPVTVMKNAGEGGAWGIALLALYTATKNGTLESFLVEIFKTAEKTTLTATETEKQKFAAFIERYKANLSVEQAAAKIMAGEV